MWTLITGASSGIGRALGLELARQGHDLLLAGRTAGKLAQVAQAVSRAAPDRAVVTLTVDLADLASTRTLAERICEVTESLGAFVYCAGVGQPAATLASLDIRDLQEALAVNVTAPMLLTQLLLPVLSANEPRSRVVMIGAGIDRQVQPGTGSYGISKMALRRLVDQLTVELRSINQGPLISLFQPGLVQTPGIQTHLRQAAALRLPHAPWLSDRLQRGDCLTPEQTASALAFVLSQTPDSDFHGGEFRAAQVLGSPSPLIA